MKKSWTSWGSAVLGAALMGAVSVALAAAPAFRSASSAAKGMSPEFRGAQSASGVSTASPTNVATGQGTPADMTHATPSITTTVANAMLVTAHSFPSSTTWTPPSGMTEGFDAQYQPVAAGVGQSIEANYAVQTLAGATGAKTATAAGAAVDYSDPGTT